MYCKNTVCSELPVRSHTNIQKRTFKMWSNLKITFALSNFCDFVLKALVLRAEQQSCDKNTSEGGGARSAGTRSSANTI